MDKKGVTNLDTNDYNFLKDNIKKAAKGFANSVICAASSASMATTGIIIIAMGMDNIWKTLTALVALSTSAYLGIKGHENAADSKHAELAANQIAMRAELQALNPPAPR